MALFSTAINTFFLLSNNSHNKLMLYYGKLRTFRKPYQNSFLLSGLSSNGCITREASSQKFVPFDNIIQNRRNEAERTLVIQVQNKKVMPKLVNYCLQYGNIKNVHHYITSQNWHHALVEFETQASAKKMLESAYYMDLDSSLPARSQFLWFKNNLIVDSSNNKNISNDPACYIKYVSPYSESDILSKLNNIHSITDQMYTLHLFLRLSDTEIRLRFITANQLEKSFACLFPHLKVLPFGSSINGFGKHGCDLDLVMNFNNVPTENKNSHFICYTKSLNDEKQKTRLCMETISEQMRYLIPGIVNVRKILKARVPIVKYSQILTNLECDLSMSNMTAIYMSELLYLYGEMDVRVRPLVFTVRKWAQQIMLTRSDPGMWISNFSLTLLILHFLQQKNIIPSVNYLQKIADKNDIRQADNHIDCTFLRNLNNLHEKTENNEKLENLLIDFFRFYGDFDFANYAISIRNGKTIKKPDCSPLYICNPLEVTLNVSRNVTYKEVQRFVSACTNSVQALKQRDVKKSNHFGLLNIFKANQILSNKNLITNNLNMQDLFNDNNNDENSVTIPKVVQSKAET